MSEFNLQLRLIRRQRNMSQEELARRLGISRQAVIAIEQGASLPSLPVIMAMLRVLDIPFQELFHHGWNPFRALETDEAHLHETHLALYRPGDAKLSIPVNLYENALTITLIAELAGVREEDVTVDLGTQHVFIMAIKKPPLTDAKYRLHQAEIEPGPRMRIVSLPAPVDTDKAQATYHRGVLHLTLPKYYSPTKRRITFQQTREIDNEKEILSD